MQPSLRERVVEQIHREGPLPFDRYMESALYDSDGGFFARGAGAGRSRGDFLTSPEVGSLFGALVAVALDRWWVELGEPDPYLVIEPGAGSGRLARDVLRAEPRCGPSLRYVMVERSEELRNRAHEHLSVEPAEEALGPVLFDDPELTPEPMPGLGPIVTALGELPVGPLTGVVIANELLDNLPFRVIERTADGWDEIRVGVGDGEEFIELPVPVDPTLVEGVEALAETTPIGARLPLQAGMAEWLQTCGSMLISGIVAVVDYAAPAESMVERGHEGWLRTYRSHQRGTGPLDAPGTQDITCDVMTEQLHRLALRAGFTIERECSQADWLRDLGIDGMVALAQSAWSERAHVGDLEALKARSIVNEAAALTDPSGLGAHGVFILRRKQRS